MMRFGGYGYNMMGGGFVMMIIPLVIIGVLIFSLYTKENKNNNYKDIGNSDNSLNILKERFALGEINEEEYINKKNILLNHRK